MLSRIYFALLLMPLPAHARSLKATADRLGQPTSTIGLALAVVAFVLSGIALLFAKHDASNKVAMALLGALLICLAPSIVSFIKSIT